MKLPAYFQFEVLPDDIKANFKIRSKSRLDLVKIFNSDNYKGLEAFKKPNGQTVLYFVPAREMVSADIRRMAEWALTDGKLNLSSLYYENPQTPGFAYGYPNPHQYIANKQINPLFPYRGDGYLFITNPHLTSLEVLVYPDCRNLINGLYFSLIDGSLDEVIKELREKAAPGVFNYGLELEPTN